MTDPVTTVSPLLTLPGAVQSEGIDAGVAAHYGNPMIEQRTLAAGRAIVDLSHRGVLSVAGPDRLTWLNSIASQELKALKPGDSTEMLLLDPNGRLEFAIRVLDDGVETWLLLEAAELPALHTFLDRMKFMLRVQVVDHTLAYATIGAMTDAPATVGLAAAAPNDVPLTWLDPWASVTRGGHQYAETPVHPGTLWTYTETLVPRASLPALRDALAAGTLTVTPALAAAPAETPALGTPDTRTAPARETDASASASPVKPAGLLALEALRIAVWRPRRAREVDEKSIPHELDWLRTAVHLSKGCYRGQETVAKVHNLGHPPRRLVMLHLDGSEGVLPAPGDPVQADRVRPEQEAERVTVGAITSSAIHYELGPIALAVIKRTIPAASTLYVESEGISISAAQEIIVPQSAGSVADIPRLPRLGVRTAH
ncbi:folate-binding protein [Cryobacterium sp. TMT1-2-2]|uniref:CAF17-like 4Fe-4S cluster assembly/insertion protein YgfZ n=1 Tax=Cryobacterium sp. TMT1-2-2 TaxID=1259233 RepID=UPI00106BCBB3|nr:folate-binding protein YgfZ [Cryobacterium sp. TMT1-2-2]TFD09746.1 folate-binding protein [Cryobacterium sp. TMT1-2-2]